MQRRFPALVSLTALLCSVVMVMIPLLVPQPTFAEGQQNSQNGREDKDKEKETEIRVTAVSLSGRSVKAGRAEGIVNASMDAVRTVVEDYASYEKFMPQIRASRVLSRRGSSALVYLQASIAKDTMTLWAQLKMSARDNAVPGKPQLRGRVIEAKMVQGNMDAMSARWELTALDSEHTLVAFQVLMDPKVPLPASLVTNENEKASQKTIRALRRVVAERATLAANDATSKR
jgi:ribosome-associated toxin RatA of RatAB toxin-antitoxin module